jgi:hypothetical protein
MSLLTTKAQSLKFESKTPRSTAVGDEVGGVVALEAAPRRPPSLIAELVQSSELSHQKSDLVVRDALVLLIRSCTQGR